MPHTVWPRSAVPRGPVPTASHCWLQRLCMRHLNTQRQVCLSLCGVSGSWCAQGFVWALWVSLGGMGFDSKWISPLLQSCWGFSFALGHWVIFCSGIQHSPFNGCLAVSCNFGVLAGKHECRSFYSTILNENKNKNKNTLYKPGPRGKEHDPTRDCPVSVQESPAEAWVSSGLLQGQGTECSHAYMGPFEGGHHYLYYLHHSLVSGQTIGREQSSAHQQKTVLKIYWEWPCPSEQDSVSPTVSLSH